MAASPYANATLEHLHAARASALALRDKVFLEIKHQKDLMRIHTNCLTGANTELAFRATDAKRAELAEEIKKLRGKRRLQAVLRLLRFYIHTRYVSPIVAKPIFSGKTVLLTFRVDPALDDTPGHTELWHAIRLNASGERLQQVDQCHMKPGVCLLTTHPRDWGF